MQIQINSFDELLRLIESGKLSNNEIVEVIEKSLNVFVIPDDLKNISEHLKTYWNEYGHLKIERPLFLKPLLFVEMIKNPTFKNEVDKLEAYY